MTVSIANSGTFTPSVLTTTYSLATTATAGTYVVKLDLINLANGDEVVFVISEAVLSGGTARTLYQATYRHAQGIPIKASPPVTAPNGLTVTLQQNTGTLRAFPWALELL